MKLEALKTMTEQLTYPITQEQYGLLRQYLQEIGMDPDNLYQELEMSSRYAQVHRDVSYSNTMLQLHSHSFYEILCCRNSCGAEYLVGSERYRLQKGDIVFVPPGVSHRPLLPEQMAEPYIRDVLWLSEEFVHSLQRQFSVPEFYSNHSGGSLLRTAGTEWNDLGDLLRDAIKESEKALPGWEILVLSTAMTFMIRLKRAFWRRMHFPSPQRSRTCWSARWRISSRIFRTRSRSSRQHATCM